jgi:hypothetical protein
MMPGMIVFGRLLGATLQPSSSVLFFWWAAFPAL